MANPVQDLNVRQHTRYACSVPAKVRIGAASADRVRLSKLALGGGSWLQATAVDLSQRGVGLRTSVFLPMNATVLIQLTMSDGTIKELTARVARVIMSDRKPTYQIGTLVDETMNAAMSDILAHQLASDGAPALVPDPAVTPATMPNPMTGGRHARP